MLVILIVVMVSQIYTYFKAYQTVIWVVYCILVILQQGCWGGGGRNNIHLTGHCEHQTFTEKYRYYNFKVYDTYLNANLKSFFVLQWVKPYTN